MLNAAEIHSAHLMVQAGFEQLRRFLVPREPIPGLSVGFEGKTAHSHRLVFTSMEKRSIQLRAVGQSLAQDIALFTSP